MYAQGVLEEHILIACTIYSLLNLVEDTPADEQVFVWVLLAADTEKVVNLEDNPRKHL